MPFGSPPPPTESVGCIIRAANINSKESQKASFIICTDLIFISNYCQLEGLNKKHSKITS
ncbi:hypothetical protein BpHYR1_006757 [Brachionus plicatilis]|uniref:Uncharacterized protein n=1 Tax=Brachionus plicatilis TaxID=10195 RepID=A0A3M7RKV5_BRAPC|nr:hypothetical protein BpHYR1_006757 [Brachionus plicatilis]